MYLNIPIPFNRTVNYELNRRTKEVLHFKRLHKIIRDMARFYYVEKYADYTNGYISFLFNRAGNKCISPVFYE